MNLLRIATAAALLAGVVMADDALKSGPQAGTELPETFEPVNINGPRAGEKTCIFCEYGENPVAMVFAREVGAPLNRLIKRLDATTAQHKPAGLASCVVFLSSDQALAKNVKQLADKEKIQHTILRTYKPEGPKGYNVAKDADITVVLFTDRLVKINRAFRKGELDDKAIDAIVADVAKILPEKK